MYFLQLENRINEMPKTEEETKKKIDGLKALEEKAVELKHKQMMSQTVRTNEIPKLR